jgi:hypothetical protein
LWIPYDQLDQHTVQLAAVKQLLAYGLVFFHDVPHQCAAAFAMVYDPVDEIAPHRETNDVDCELPKLAERLGEIRRTWYGDRVWDVKSMADAKNIACASVSFLPRPHLIGCSDTNLDLGLHMDLLCVGAFPMASGKAQQRPGTTTIRLASSSCTTCADMTRCAAANPTLSMPTTLPPTSAKPSR